MTTLNALAIHSIFVLDQDEALDFYVGKLGLEVEADVDMGFMRWLTVRVPGDGDRRMLLEVPGAPSQSETAAQQLRDLLTQGALGMAANFTTDDARGYHERLVEAGVDVTEEPQQQPYGVDFAIRDPFGNHIRITQPMPMRELTEEDIQRWSGESA